MNKAAFVWSEPTGLGRNVFVIFRRSFRLAGPVSRAAINLFGDTRYRLRINGHIAAYGPARFLPSNPEYDTVDLMPFLAKGRNVITVEVNSRGASGFDAMPSIGGFIAWGEVRQTGKPAIDLATPGKWKAMARDAWDTHAPPFSFAQGPAEVLDTRLLPAGVFDADFDDSAWPEAVRSDSADNWGEFSQRSIPMLGMDLRTPSEVVLLQPLQNAEHRFGFRVPGPYPSKPADDQIRAAYATYIHSPQEQDVTLGLFWGPHYLNGQEIKATPNKALGNREDFPVRLRQGWNFLYGEPELLFEGWGMLIGIPTDKNLTARAEPSEDSLAFAVHTLPMLRSELHRARGNVPENHEQLPKVESGWTRVPREGRPPMPAREMGWDLPQAGERQHLAPQFPIEMPLSDGGQATVVFDLGGEYLGHVSLDIDAAAGTIFDVAYSEKLTASGAIGMYADHPFVNCADRLIARGGRQTIEAFHPRGGRYVQVTVREAMSPVTLHSAAIRQTTVPIDVQGKFSCPDPIFNWTWNTGIATQLACIEDSFLDCPWRERGLYLGDALIEFQATRCATDDVQIVKRCLRLWANSQKPDGQMYDVVPSWHESTLYDFSLIWIILLYEYWAVTGDKALVKEVYLNMHRVLSSPAWKQGPHGLWSSDDIFVFVDWGITEEGRKGENGVLNAYRYHALNCASALAGAIGQKPDVDRFAREARKVKKSFGALWNGKANRFAAGLNEDGFIDTPSLHANTLAVLYGLAERSQVEPAIQYMLEGLRPENAVAPGHLELYFQFFALNILYDHVRTAEAEQIIRYYYGTMKARGAWTIWETYAWGLQNQGSLCHGWSAGGAITATRRTLGIRHKTPGDPRDILIAPNADGITSASGVYPHPAGPIEVSWQRVGKTLDVHVIASKTIRLTVQPEGPLAKLEVKLTRKST